MAQIQAQLVQKGDIVSIFDTPPFVVTDVRPHRDQKTTIFRPNGQQYSLYHDSQVTIYKRKGTRTAEQCEHGFDRLFKDGDEPGELLELVTCSLCNPCRDSRCPTCRGFVLSPSDYRRKDKVCACQPDSLVHGNGGYAGCLARFVAPVEQFHRDPVDPELKNRQFSTYPSDTGQTDLGSELPFASAPDLDDTEDRFGELMGFAFPLTTVPIPAEHPDEVFLRDGLDLADTVSQTLWDEALLEGLVMDGFGYAELPLDDMEVEAEWISISSTRHAEWFNALLRKPDSYPMCGTRESLTQWRNKRGFNTAQMTLR